jgi:hypothetical protein
MSSEARAVRVAQARGALEALRRIGEDLAGIAATRTAPVETGDLRGSIEVAYLVNGVRHEGPGAFASALVEATVAAAAGQLRSLNVEVSANTIYAARQHEELDWSHPLGGQAKYLEAPLVERAPRYARIVDRAQEAEVAKLRAGGL